MAKRRTRYVTRYRAAKRRYPRTFAAGGKFKPAISGLIARAGGKLGAGFLGAYSQPVANGAVGYLMKDKTAMFLAGYGAADLLLGNGGNISTGGMVR